MSRYGMIAGNGRFPLLALETARRLGDQVVAIGILEEASPEFDEAARNKAVGVIITSQTRALLQRAESVLGRAATSEDVETVTWGTAE